MVAFCLILSSSLGVDPALFCSSRILSSGVGVCLGLLVWLPGASWMLSVPNAAHCDIFMCVTSCVRFVNCFWQMRHWWRSILYLVPYSAGRLGVENGVSSFGFRVFLCRIVSVCGVLLFFDVFYVCLAVFDVCFSFLFL